MNKKILYLFVSIFFICSLFSCIDNEFSSSTTVKPEKSIFGDSSTIIIPDNFDWDNYKEVTLNVTVDTVSLFKEDYTISVYDYNPLNNDSAILLSQGVCKGGEEYNTTISVPNSTSSLCIMQKNPDGRKVFLIKNIAEDSNVTVDFTKSTPTLKSAYLRSADIQAGDNEVVSSNVEIKEESLPTTYTTLNTDTKTSKLNWADGVTYYLPSGVTLDAESKNINSQSELYISGTLNLSKNFSMSGNAKLIILNGGKLNITKNLKMQISNDCIFQVQDGGQLSSQDYKRASLSASNDVTILLQGSTSFDDFTTSNDVKILNTGDMDVDDDMSITNSNIFSNLGNLVIGGDLKMSSDAEFYNNGNLDADEITISGSNNSFYNGEFLKSNSLTMSSSNNRLTNKGQMIIEKELSTNGGYLVSKTKSYIKCETWKMTNTTVYFEDDVMMDVTKKTTFSNQSNFFGGVEGGKSLFKSKEIKFGWKTWLSGNLDIASNKYNENSKWGHWYVVYRDYVTFCDYDESMTTITSSDYSPGNNYTPSSEDETEVDLSEPVSNTNNYTFVMEDLFPIFGDFDMNDLVVSLDSIENYMDENNYLEKSIIHLRLRAVGGATAGVGFFLQLDGIDKNNIESVENSNTISNFNNFAISKGLEDGQRKPVIPIFDDVHGMFGVDSNVFVNTVVEDSTSTYKDDVPLTLTITYTDNTVSAEFLNKKYLNFFGVKGVDNGRRYEIHAPGYDYTDLNKTKIDNTGYNMWALIIPGEFQYPKEYTSIVNAYPNFINWVHSDKKENLDWYDYPNDDLIYK